MSEKGQQTEKTAPDPETAPPYAEYSYPTPQVYHDQAEFDESMAPQPVPINYADIKLPIQENAPIDYQHDQRGLHAYYAPTFAASTITRDQSEVGSQVAMYPGFQTFQQEPEEKKKKLRPWIMCGIVFGIVVLFLLVGMGVALGVVLGRNSQNNTNQSNNPTSQAANGGSNPTNGVTTISVSGGGTSVITLSSNNTSAASTATTTGTGSSSATTTGASQPTGTGSLNFIDAYWENVESSSLVKPQIIRGDNFVLDMNANPWNIPDPLKGSQKCLAMLFSYGSSIRTFAACESSGVRMIVPGDVALSPNTLEITRQGPSTDNWALVSVVWSGQEIRTPAVYTTLFNYHVSGTSFTCSINLFNGVDPLPGKTKSAVIWYTTDNFQTFKAVACLEGASIKL